MSLRRAAVPELPPVSELPPPALLLSPPVGGGGGLSLLLPGEEGLEAGEPEGEGVLLPRPAVVAGGGLDPSELVSDAGGEGGELLGTEEAGAEE